MTITTIIFKILGFFFRINGFSTCVLDVGELNFKGEKNTHRERRD